MIPGESPRVEPAHPPRPIEGRALLLALALAGFCCGAPLIIVAGVGTVFLAFGLLVGLPILIAGVGWYAYRRYGSAGGRGERG